MLKILISTEENNRNKKYLTSKLKIYDVQCDKIKFSKNKGKFSIFCLRGISGSGKGSRVSHLLVFLSGIFTNFKYLIVDKKTCIGIFFPEINTVFLGKWVISNKSNLISWSSHDWLQIYNFKKTLNNFTFNEVLVKLRTDYNVDNLIFEGYPCMMNPLNIFDLYNEQDKPSIHTYYYIYNTFEEMQYRVLHRSGKEIKGTCWVQNKSIVKEYNNFLNTSNLGDNLKFNVNEPIHTFGEIFLNKINRADLIEEYLKYSKKFNTLRDLDVFNESIDKLVEFYNEQQSFIKISPDFLIQENLP